MPQNKIIVQKLLVIISSLKWAWDFLLLQSSFFRYSRSLDALTSEIDFYCSRHGSDTTGECAVCLCGIEEGEEIRELKCSHIFHSCCFDRWVGYGRWTCPLCRSHLQLPRVDAETMISQQVLLLNFVKLGLEVRRHGGYVNQLTYDARNL